MRSASTDLRCAAAIFGHMVATHYDHSTAPEAATECIALRPTCSSAPLIRVRAAVSLPSRCEYNGTPPGHQLPRAAGAKQLLRRDMRTGHELDSRRLCLAADVVAEVHHEPRHGRVSPVRLGYRPGVLHRIPSLDA